MMTADGIPLEAHFELEGKTVQFHARGGSKTGDSRNSEYGPGLRLMLQRLHIANISIDGVWVNSSAVQGIPLDQRLILTKSEWDRSPLDAFTLLSSRMKTVGQLQEAVVKGGGNATKKLRIDLAIDLPEAGIADILGGQPTDKNLRSLDRLPAEMLERVTAENVWNAVQGLLTGQVSHQFGPSIDFDLIADDGSRLPPKAVFGVAASLALGFPVLPRHFAGGPQTPCFRILKRSGYEIVPKNAKDPTVDLPQNRDDQEWAEGNPKLVKHLKRERAKGLSNAKRAAFKGEHGRLFCERCKMDPVKTYGSETGEACIEVHHRETQVKDMDATHTTKLSDLQCLCASCHRVVHRELKQALAPFAGDQAS